MCCLPVCLPLQCSCYILPHYADCFTAHPTPLQLLLPAALKGRLPGDVAELTPLLRLMTLGGEGRQMLRDKKYR